MLVTVADVRLLFCCWLIWLNLKQHHPCALSRYHRESGTRKAVAGFSPCQWSAVTHWQRSQVAGWIASESGVTVAPEGGPC
eukprot:1243364-Rhodomonas_salina.1